MPKNLKISSQDLLQQLKLSGKITELITELLNRKIILEKAQELGIKVSADELQKSADQLRLVNQLHNADKTWQWLKMQKLSLDDFEEMIFFNLVSFKLAFHLFQEKIEPYFIEHQLDYMGVVMYQVIFDDQELALEKFYAIEDKEICFFDVAYQYIKNPEFKRTLGYQGILHRRDLKPDISAAIFVSNPPQILKPINSSQGFHLIFVEEIIKPQLTEELAYQIGLELFNQWLKIEREQIEYELIFE